MSHKKVAGLDMNYFWRRSLSSSLIASHLANEAVKPHRDEAFIGALLADIGIPILAEAFPDKYAPALSRFAPGQPDMTAEEEIAAVEVTHAEVSAMVLAHWTLPKTICGAVNLHQSSHPGDDDTAAIGRILNASDRISALLCVEADEDQVVDTCTDAMSFVHVDVGVLVKLLPIVERDVEELADALRIDVLPCNAYASVARALTEWLRGVAAV
jgi:HD-like signal output (HDOD) protein